ncbi:hypothetical protein FRC11_007877 [Ceratobasidium sp. 423]|nr:hypothetical protein FRC11_007877 [Ceratobasidium sp. 423]
MAGGAPQAAAQTAPLSNDDIGFYTDILILFVLLFFTITALPRVFARLSHRTAWKDGWIILRGSSSAAALSKFSSSANSSTFSVTRKPTYTSKGGLSRSNTEKRLGGLGSTESETFESSYAPRSFNVNVVSHLRAARGIQGHEPTRVPSYHSMLHPVSKVVSARYAGYSVGQYIILVAYGALMCVAMFLFANPVTNIKRSGFVCISQIPVVFALGTKNSLVGWLVGMGYEKLNYIHRWVGQLMFIAGLFHVVGFLVKWTKSGVITIAAKSQFWGWMAFGGLVFCVILSLPVIRRSSYNIFWHSHWIGLVIMLFASCLHVPECIPYCVAAGAIYGLDQLMRIVKSHWVTATITPVPEMKCTQAEQGNAKTRSIDLVWVVQEHKSAAPLLPVFAALMSRASTVHTLSMRVRIHYTRATESVPTSVSELVGHELISFVAGRPDITQAVSEAVRRTAVGGTAGGVVVGVCGPQALVEDVWKAERAVGSELRKAAGGVEVHEEAFGW